MNDYRIFNPILTEENYPNYKPNEVEILDEDFLTYEQEESINDFMRTELGIVDRGIAQWTK